MKISKEEHDFLVRVDAKNVSKEEMNANEGIVRTLIANGLATDAITKMGVWCMVSEEGKKYLKENA